MLTRRENQAIPKPLDIETLKMNADILLSEDLEARAKVVKCKYDGGCNVWYYNKDDFCDYCLHNLEAKEDPYAKPIKPKAKSHSSDKGRGSSRRTKSTRRDSRSS